MAKKKVKENIELAKILVTPWGEYEVFTEDNQYYYCNGTKFRKDNPAILEVK